MFKVGDRIRRKKKYCQGTFYHSETRIFTIIQYQINSERVFLKEIPKTGFDAFRFELVKYSCNKPSWL